MSPRYVYGHLLTFRSEVSRQFGFLRFATLQDSRAFVERNYPMIYLYGSNSAENNGEAAKVRIAFSRERDERHLSERAEGEWTCKIVSQLTTALRDPAYMRTVYSCQLCRSREMFPLPNSEDW